MSSSGPLQVSGPGELSQLSVPHTCCSWITDFLSDKKAACEAEETCLWHPDNKTFPLYYSPFTISTNRDSLDSFLLGQRLPTGGRLSIWWPCEPRECRQNKSSTVSIFHIMPSLLQTLYSSFNFKNIHFPIFFYVFMFSIVNCYILYLWFFTFVVLSFFSLCLLLCQVKIPSEIPSVCLTVIVLCVHCVLKNLSYNPDPK